MSSNEINGLYRYQGTQFGSSTKKENCKEVEYHWGASNYICFGTNDTNECLINKNRYMYRIIGVNKNGGLKLIKDENLTFLTWSSDESKTLWEESNVFQYLN